MAIIVFIKYYMKIDKIKLQKNVLIGHEFCWILFCSSVSIPFIIWSNIAPSLKSWTIFNSRRKELLKMSKRKILGALLAEKLQNEKRKEFCGTPCKLV